MTERRDCSMPATRTPYISMWRAAAVAFERLFPEQPEKDARLLDVIALALSALMPIYKREMQSGALRELTEAEVIAGDLACEALLVSLPELERALPLLGVGSPEAARASLTLRQGRRL
jgi:hypothetical protein